MPRRVRSTATTTTTRLAQSARADLDRFRADWLANLARRREGQVSDPAGGESNKSNDNDKDNDNDHNDDDVYFFNTIDKESLDSAAFCVQLTKNLAHGTAEIRLRAAIRIYELAVAEEVQGNLSDSLKLYRFAFRVGLETRKDREQWVKWDKRWNNFHTGH